MTRNRFTNTACFEFQEINRCPIFGYQHLPILTLEEALEKIILLIPDTLEYIRKAKENCNQNSTVLSWNESAAIYLYTMSSSFFSHLNTALRAENRHVLKPWFTFLKLFITALQKLPSIKTTVWRGINYDDTLTFIDSDIHIWWSFNSCSMALNIVQPFLGEKGTLFAIDTIHGKDISIYSAIPDEQEVILMPGTRVRAKCQSLSFNDRLFIVHLQEEEENLQSKSPSELNYLYESIKEDYRRHSRIKCIMNPSKSFSIEQSYINLAIVETKEQQEKEKKLLNVKFNNDIIGTYEEIYGMKTKIEIEKIFEKCKDQIKNILILGRAGIGKTTFCRYVSYQWAIGTIWQQYHLLIFIRLRNLTESRYPPLLSGVRYSLIDLIKTEYSCHNLTGKDEQILKEQFNTNKILWLLDGYDEIIQNIPLHLQYLMEQLLKTPHHIITSRPYLNTLSYTIGLEIIGFTDDNIKEYVKQFFEQLKDEIDDALVQGEKLQNFLECNPRVWGIVHIPVNLELMCSLWCDTDWSDMTTLTMTIVYDKIIEWLCRRYLKRQHICSSHMVKEDVYRYCCKELTILESLAFYGIENNTIILRPQLLRIALKESEYPLQYQLHLLNMGILKSLDYKPIGTYIEMNKNHYFIHLSFQEHFAARYLVKAINGNLYQRERAIDFIKINKYNQRFELILTFVSGLLFDNNDRQVINLFWDTLLSEPLDLIGLRHVQIVISCLEETGCNRYLSQYQQLINLIIKWIIYSVSKDQEYLYQRMGIWLQKCPSLVNQPEILNTFIMLYQRKDLNIKKYTYFLLCNLLILDPMIDLIHLHLTALTDDDTSIRRIAYNALGKMGGKATTNEVINRLLNLFEDSDDFTKWKICEVIGMLGEKVATIEIINKLKYTLRCKNQFIRRSACEALGKLGEKARTDEVVTTLIMLLDDKIHDVKLIVCETLQKMIENDTNHEILNKILNAFGDTNPYIRQSACEIVGKLSDKVVTKDIINRLVCDLGHTNLHIRRSACGALYKLGTKKANNELIHRLVSALKDTNHYIRRNACEVFNQLGYRAAITEVIESLANTIEDLNSDVKVCALDAISVIGEKAAYNHVISKVVRALQDENSDVRFYACSALGNMIGNVLNNELMNGLNHALEDFDDHVRRTAFVALGKVGEKTMTIEVMHKLMKAFEDDDNYVRRIVCKAIGRIRIEEITDKMIENLVNALEDLDDYVRRDACEALGKLGKVVETDKVIGSLIKLLNDINPEVRQSVCEALRKITEKTMSYIVLDTFATALNDSNYGVRVSASKALEILGEKTMPIDVINQLVNALDHADPDIRRNVCKIMKRFGARAATMELINKLVINAMKGSTSLLRYTALEALTKIGEKAATNEVIHGLIGLLEDADYCIRCNACEALGNMGEKVITNEVIYKLTNALRDTNHNVRRDACAALSNINEKETTSEVINMLINVLWDKNAEVRRNASTVLCKIGKKITNNELLKQLLETCHDTNPEIQDGAIDTTVNILSSLSSMSHIDDDTIEKLSLFINRFTWKIIDKVPPKIYIEAFLNTKSQLWLPIIQKILLLQNNAVTMTSNTITVYSNNEPVQIHLTDMEIKQQLAYALINSTDELS